MFEEFASRHSACDLQLESFGNRYDPRDLPVGRRYSYEPLVGLPLRNAGVMPYLDATPLFSGHNRDIRSGSKQRLDAR